MSVKPKFNYALWGSYAALGLFVVFFLTPPFYMLVTSLKTAGEISAEHGNPWIVTRPTLGNYAELLTNAHFLGFFWNSIKVTVCLVILTMIISVFAAFSLARMKFFGSGVLATGIFLTYLVPESLLFIPLPHHVYFLRRPSLDRKGTALDQGLERTPAQPELHRQFHDGQELDHPQVPVPQPVPGLGRGGVAGDQRSVQVEERADTRAARTRVDLRRPGRQGHRTGIAAAAHDVRPETAAGARVHPVTAGIG